MRGDGGEDLRQRGAVDGAQSKSVPPTLVALC